MLRWFQALLPREDNFFRLFAAHADTLVVGAAALRRMLDGGEETPTWCAAIVDAEHKADDVAREVLVAVRRSFITPFDRSDIRRLTNSLDDAVDQMQKTAKAVTLYEVRDFSPHMRELGDVAVQAAALTVEAVSLLPEMTRERLRLNALTEQIAHLESHSDDLYDAGMKALYQAQKREGGGDALAFIIGAEIYDHLEKVVDRFEDVANHINGVLVEHL
ncbi:MAG: nuclease [Caulobacter sp.]|nr:nuclease [Caulobacter sp.]